jgi:hypothetical protein
MKKKVLLLITLSLTIVVFAISLTGCWLFKAPEVTGLQMGFKTPRYNGIVVGVKSENTEFDLDDITLNLYYGLRDTKIGQLSDKERYERFIAAYFIKGEYANKLSSTFDYYKNIEGFYFITDIPLEEFNSSAYEVKNSKTPSKYAHSEQITIPEEFINSVKYDYFYFTVQVVIFYKQENKYEFYSRTNRFNKGWANTVCINSKVLENNKVQLSER